MTGDRLYFVARSIAALDDSASIESCPLSQIRADLAKLGIDPKASITAARKLARKRSTPADRLLSRLDDADDIDAEIAALEHVDGADLRGKIPAGAAASITADARRRAGMPSNVTGLNRSRRRVFGWGGSMIGIAACLLLFVMIRPDQLYQPDQSVIEEADDVADIAEARSADKARLEEAFDTRQPTQLAESDEAADQEVTLDRELALAEPRRRVGQSNALPAPEAEEVLENLASRAMKSDHGTEESAVAEALATARLSAKAREPADEEVSATALAPAAAAAPTPEVFHIPKAKPARPATTSEASITASAPKAFHIPKARPANPAAPNQAVAAPKAETVQILADAQASGRSALSTTTSALVADDVGSVQKELGQSDFSAAETNTAGFVDSADEWHSPQAVLIVDPDKAPPVLKAQAETLPKGGLVDRLDEARRLAGDRDVVALVTILREGKEVDAVLALLPQSEFAGIDAITGFTAAPPISEDEELELIELSKKP